MSGRVSAAAHWISFKGSVCLPLATAEESHGTLIKHGHGKQFRNCTTSANSLLIYPYIYIISPIAVAKSGNVAPGLDREIPLLTIISSSSLCFKLNA